LFFAFDAPQVPAGVRRRAQIGATSPNPKSRFARMRVFNTKGLAMAKRRKRRSSKDLTARAMKDIRNLHRAHLREISAILTNTLGFPVKVSMVPAAQVEEKPARKTKRGKVERVVAHVAGWGDDAHAPTEVEARDLPHDEVGF
jgi:hypothetical protein